METENTNITKSLPHNIEAEAYLLASLLIDNDSFDKLLSISHKISSEDFYDTRHQYIFQAIEALKKRNTPIDIITITEELTNVKLLDKSGGINYINSLIDRIPTSANIEYYGKIVKSKALLRRLIAICNDTIAKSLDSQTNVEELVDQAEKKIFDINEEKHSSSLSEIKQSLYEIIEQVSKAKSNQGEVSGVSSGYYTIDEVTDGFHPSELIVVAARPSMGKTSFVLNVAARTAMKHNNKVGVFSCEMSKISLVKRLLCCEARVDQLRMRKNMLKAEEIEKLITEAERLYDTTIVFDDTPNISILELRSKARRMKKDYNIDILMIDYLQLVTVDDDMKRTPRHEQIAYVSRSLKGLARQLNIPVIALAQLNREIESRGEDSRPRLSDLKDSGSIEQDADLIVFIHKGKTSDVYQDPDQMKEPREIIIGKNRSGPTGIIPMIFVKNFTRFEIMSKEL